MKGDIFAFARPYYYSSETGEDSCQQRGMTLLDYFAGQALMGMLASDPKPEFDENIYAVASYKIAEAMINERNKRNMKEF